MHDTVLVRYGEISLKGQNRGFFENRLISNIKKCLNENKIAFTKISRPRGRILIETNDNCDCLKLVYGITSFSHAIVSDGTIEAIKEAAPKLTKELTKTKSFRVSAQRLDKRIAMKSNEIDREIGGFVQDMTQAKVNLKNYDFELGIEMFEGNAYLFTDRIGGPGGLPVGVEGTVLVLKDKDAKLAAELMQKRGCETIIINNVSEAGRYKSARALVVCQTLQNLKEVDTTLPVLRPLI